MEDKCICCGRVIPEGRHICMNCEHENEMQDFKRKTAKPRTNGDRIRQMTDEELCDFLDGFLCYKIEGYCRADEIDCRDCKMKWLQQEVSEDAGTY